VTERFKGYQTPLVRYGDGCCGESAIRNGVAQNGPSGVKLQVLMVESRAQGREIGNRIQFALRDCDLSGL